MRQACLETLYGLAKRDPRIFFIGSDMGADAVAFKTEMPDRFFLEGIGEANVVGLAAGLALDGKIPYVNSIGAFLTRRSFEQIVLDLCLHKANVRLLGNGGGLAYAPLGPTLMATDDLAILRSVPGMTIIAPADAPEMRRLMPKTVDHPGPIYVRLAKGSDPAVTRESDPFVIGKAIAMREGGDALIVTTGTTLRPALEAADALVARGVATAVLHCHTVKPLDKEAILKYAAPAAVVVSIEEHSIIGGLGSAVAEILAEEGFSPAQKFKRIGIPDAFADDYGSQESLLRSFRITAEELVSSVLELSRGRRIH
ncbi:MAG: transketolase family protein [Elusimicrobiota bacterium]